MFLDSIYTWESFHTSHIQNYHPISETRRYKEYTKTSYIGLNIGWEVLSCSEAIAWRSLSEQLIHRSTYDKDCARHSLEVNT
jgi:hypothetical protein